MDDDENWRIRARARSERRLLVAFSAVFGVAFVLLLTIFALFFTNLLQQ